MAPDRAAAPGASLTVERVSVRYGQALGLDSVSLSIEPGEVTMVVGPNGAGKTSLLRAIAGFMTRHDGRVSGGRVLLDGRDVTGVPPHARAQVGVRLVPERQKIFAHLTVRQNLQVLAGRRVGPADLEAVITRFPAIERRLMAKAGTLSGGERQMLALTPAILTTPRLLLVDEMSLGLAPATASDAARALHNLQRDRGFTLLMVEQSTALTEIADRVVEMSLEGVSA